MTLKVKKTLGQYIQSMSWAETKTLTWTKSPWSSQYTQETVKNWWKKPSWSSFARAIRSFGLICSWNATKDVPDLPIRFPVVNIFYMGGSRNYEFWRLVPTSLNYTEGSENFDGNNWKCRLDFSFMQYDIKESNVTVDIRKEIRFSRCSGNCGKTHCITKLREKNGQHLWLVEMSLVSLPRLTE